MIELATAHKKADAEVRDLTGKPLRGSRMATIAVCAASRGRGAALLVTAYCFLG
jgi:hypothetical protein